MLASKGAFIFSRLCLHVCFWFFVAISSPLEWSSKTAENSIFDLVHISENQWGKATAWNIDMGFLLPAIGRRWDSDEEETWKFHFQTRRSLSEFVGWADTQNFSLFWVVWQKREWLILVGITCFTAWHQELHISVPADKQMQVLQEWMRGLEECRQAARIRYD